jgi:hypothetical protein
MATGKSKGRKQASKPASQRDLSLQHVLWFRGESDNKGGDNDNDAMTREQAAVGERDERGWNGNEERGGWPAVLYPKTAPTRMGHPCLRVNGWRTANGERRSTIDDRRQ